MTLLEWAMLIALSVLWGGAFFFNGVIVKELPVFTAVALRVSLAALILWSVLLLIGQGVPRDARAWRAFFIMGILNNVIPFSLIVWGQTHVASGVAAIINATTPLFTVVIAHALTRDEKMNAASVCGVLVGLAGVALMIGGDALESLGVNIAAQLGFVGAAISYALSGVFGRRFRAMNLQPLTTAAGQVTASSVMLVPLALFADRPWLLPFPGMPVAGAVIGLAALSTALAYILFFRIMATAGATNVSLVTFLVPISAILLGVLILHEVLLPKHLAGMAMIGLGLALIDGRLVEALRPTRG